MTKKQIDTTEESTADSTDHAISYASHEELTKQLNEAEQKANENWERVLRMQAEAENMARRMERELANAHKYSLEKFANTLLPIIDSLELCLVNSPADVKASAQAVIDGVNLTLKLFYSAMEKFGIKQLDPINQPFDPEHHQSISVQADTDAAPGTVVSVMQKGYSLNGRLLRPALVVVAK